MVARPTRSASGHGTNSVLVGDFNERVILSTLRRFGPASKAEIARRVGLTSNATGVIVRKLEDGGLVRNTGKRYGGRGQPATLLELDPGGAFAIGVRIDRDMIACVLVDLQGAILDRAFIDRLPPPDEAVAEISEHVRRFRRGLGPRDNRRVAGIGIATPYNFGSWLAELGLSGETLKAWDGFDLQGALALATGLPIVVENDGSAAAVGELLHGHGRAYDDFIYFFIGPAIGGGVVLDGDYLRGMHANAGDVAVMPVGPSQLVSVPPRQVPHMPLIGRASLSVLARHLRWRGGATRSSTDLDDAIDRMPDAFGEWVEDAADALAFPILTSVHLLDVDTVIVAGDLSPAHLGALTGRIAERVAGTVAESRQPPKVIVGAVGRDAGAVGAASLPFHVSYSPMRDLLTGSAPENFMEVLA
jgi:predicted NBD/HSP70 family sugar kinase